MFVFCCVWELFNDNKIEKGPLGRPSCCNSWERVSASTSFLTAFAKMKYRADNIAFMSEDVNLVPSVSRRTLAYYMLYIAVALGWVEGRRGRAVLNVYSIA